MLAKDKLRHIAALVEAQQLLPRLVRKEAGAKAASDAEELRTRVERDAVHAEVVAERDRVRRLLLTQVPDRDGGQPAGREEVVPVLGECERADGERDRI